MNNASLENIKHDVTLA